MKTRTTVITVIGVLILIGIIWLIAQGVKKNNIKNAAISSGIPVPIATSIANSSNPAQAARMIGVPDAVAVSIAAGIPVTMAA